MPILFGTAPVVRLYLQDFSLFVLQTAARQFIQRRETFLAASRGGEWSPRKNVKENAVKLGFFKEKYGSGVTSSFGCNNFWILDVWRKS